MFGSCAVDSNERFYSLATCGRPLNDTVLDWMLGKGHVALLRRAKLKTFVDFHGNEARKGGDLTPDETTIIVGALKLTEKTAKDAMTPISKSFSIDLDGTLNLWCYRIAPLEMDDPKLEAWLVVPHWKRKIAKWPLARHGVNSSDTLEKNERDIDHHYDAALSRWATILH
ncbi:DUF21 domain-containing protein [Capsicum chinense]|nr:DUF21 domain-containing protein [Capsicum chinense]